MSDGEVEALWLKERGGAKFVRAFCKVHGWRWTKQGAPEEWFVAWRGGVDTQLNRVLEREAGGR